MTDVLDLIDGAISDWETSPDAMRWSAEPPAEEPEYKQGGFHLTGTDLAPPDDLDRIDTVAFRGEESAIFRGEPSRQPAPPVLPTGWVPLSYVRVAGTARTGLPDSATREPGLWRQIAQMIAADSPTSGRYGLLIPSMPPTFTPGSPQFAAIMPAICTWLEANGIEPKRVPIHAVPAVFRGWIYLDTYVWGADGPVVVGSQPKERTIRVPLVEPLPDVLKPWWLTGDSGPIGRWYDERFRLGAMHSAYSRRVRARRRRGRRR